MRIKPYVKVKYYVMCHRCNTESQVFNSLTALESFLASNGWAKGGDAFVLCPNCSRRFEK